MNEKIAGCPFCYMSAKDRRFLLLEQGNWQVFLADKQDYIGRCIVVHKQHLDYLGDASAQDFMDLMMVVRLLEKAAESVFDATNFNWSCLMNDAFKQEFYHPHLHLHFRPRYEDPVRIGDSLYTDDEFSHHYDNHKPDLLTEQEKRFVFEQFSHYFHS